MNSGDIKATSCADITASDRTITHSDLVINKLHQYREKFSDLEEIQTLYNIGSERMKDLVNGIDEAVETSIITMLDAYFTAHSSQVQTIASMSVSTVAKDIMGLRTALSKKDVPMNNRILVVSPDVSAVIAQAGILAGTEVAADAAVEGWLGKFGGFSIFESNLITSTNVYAFRAKAFNYVRQLVYGLCVGDLASDNQESEEEVMNLLINKIHEETFSWITVFNSDVVDWKELAHRQLWKRKYVPSKWNLENREIIKNVQTQTSSTGDGYNLKNI